MSKILLRRDTTVNWSSNNPVLDIGEPAYDLTTKSLKIGNGYDRWLSLPTITSATNFDSTLFINVKNYGVVGNGVADDTSAIQSLLDTYTSYDTPNRGNSPDKSYVLFFPQGKYKITSSLKVQSGITLLGAGRNSLIYSTNSSIGQLILLTEKWKINNDNVVLSVSNIGSAGSITFTANYVSVNDQIIVTGSSSNLSPGTYKVHSTNNTNPSLATNLVLRNLDGTSITTTSGSSAGLTFTRVFAKNSYNCYDITIQNLGFSSTGDTWTIKHDNATVINARLLNLTYTGKYGVNLSGYTQSSEINGLYCYDYGNDSTHATEQMLFLKGNRNYIKNIDSEGNNTSVGTTTEPYILIQHHDAQVVGEKSAGNTLEDILIECNYSTNKCLIKLDGCEDTVINKFWNETASGYTSNGYNLDFIDCRRITIRQYNISNFSGRKLRINHCDAITIDTLFLEAYNDPYDYATNITDLITIDDINTSSSPSNLHIETLHVPRGTNLYPFDKLKSITIGKSIIKNDAFDSMSLNPYGFKGVNQQHHLGNNILVNSSFEAGTYGWKDSGVNSVNSFNRSPTSVTQLDSEVGFGKMLKINFPTWSYAANGGGSFRTAFYQDVTVPAGLVGKPLTFSMMIKVTGGAETYRGWDGNTTDVLTSIGPYIVGCGVPINAISDPKVNLVAKGTGWHMLTQTLTPIAEGTLSVGFISFGATEVYVDDARLSTGIISSPSISNFGSLEISGKPVVMASTVPLTGTWPAGSRIINSNPSVGQPKGWVRTSLGIWESEGNLGESSSTGGINVKQYGAVGDGTTDDTVAIQAALDAISTVGGCVYFPRGTYLISSNLQVSSNTQLLGESLSSVIKTTSTNATEFMVRAKASSSNITITNLSFDVNKHTAIIAVAAPSADISNFTVEKCSFYNASTNKDQASYVAAYTMSGTAPTNIKISGCTFTANYSAVSGTISNGSTSLTLGTAVTGMVVGQGVRIMDLSGNILATTNIASIISTTSITLANAVSRTDGLTTAQVAIGLTVAISVRGGASNIIIENNTINTYIGIRSNNYYNGATTVGCTDLRIENNRITKAHTRAILLEQVTRAVVTGNIMTDSPCTSGTFGISIQTSSKDVIVSNNILDTSGEISCYLSSNVQIIGNRIKGSNCAGIEINDFNTDIGNSQAAQPLDTYNIVVTNNIIASASFSGIFCSATDVLLKSNIITDCLANGIKVAEQGLRVTIADNDIKNCAAKSVPTTTRLSVSSNSTSIPVNSGTGIKNGDSITIFGAGVGGTNLNTTVSSGGGTTTLTIATPTSSPINSNAAVYTYYEFGGIRLGNYTDSSPGIVDCFVENNMIIDSRTTKLHIYGIVVSGPINNVTIRNNKVDGYIEYNLYNNVSGDSSTLVSVGNSWQSYVTKIIAGTNVSIDPVSGSGDVTINATSTGGGGGTLASRTDKSATTVSLGANVTNTTTNITGAFKGYVIYKATVSSAAWVRVYADNASRTADFNSGRTQTSDPTTSGVIAEFITSGSSSQTIVVSPAIFGFNNEPSPTTTIPITVTNLGANPTAITVTLTLLQTEA